MSLPAIVRTLVGAAGVVDKSSQMALGVVVSNERLRGALANAGHTAPSLAEETGVDPKTVQRWLGRGIVPHRTTACRVARLLGCPPGWLWPDLDNGREPTPDAEVVTLYPRRSLAPDQFWLDLLAAATADIWLFANASLFLPEDNPNSIALLRTKAQAGTRVRIMLGDPDSPAVAIRTYEERIPIAGRVAMAIAYYFSLAGAPGVEFRQHATSLYNSIFRFDDQMLVNQHACGVYGCMAPLLHLRRMHDGGLFDTYVGGFERIWNEESSPFREPA